MRQVTGTAAPTLLRNEPRRRDPRTFQPFLKLGRLLAGIAPGRSPLPDGTPINLAVGDPQQPAPALLSETIAAYPNGWSSYPPFRGTPEYQQAAVDWLARRYGLPEGFIEGERHVLPIPGSREGLFFAGLSALSLGAAEGRDRVLLPAPGYHVYAGAAAAAGAEPVFVPATRETGFLPDFAALDPAILDRTAIAFVCAPSNPEGAAADLPRWRALLALARRHGFLLAADECYAEIYFGEPPAGALQAALETGSLDNLLVFHSLSKRSNAAGLRCGFLAGDPGLVDAVEAFCRFGGASVALPVLQAGAALWNDDGHAAVNRAFYANLFERAEATIGGRFGWSKPDGGFFLWLQVGDDEAAAVRLWREAGIRTLPGSYMVADTTLQPNPAAGFLRVAMVFDETVTVPALERLVEVLDG
ncbi:Aspartate/methionine/tyrosine aminotransferase [Tistlia consotensis]|uniref:Aspartate/methionine/tyrosine aminotransferase n=1 Tax=Tistlia consotensis USBA 355 TaxID=560819 RepID=A0A1Y6BHI9_9PROT|nr:aminotransferase class I/II-fold pyridoxal phosphate-dependent enzyme [Tistlia consotensis]SMF09459.1 Aspartate/methionine/tyrosine aminotransferase [Tistlia consotensis USBA 355]SNR34521.1 Aspartate/methionine/tyrosine aminotransferase [Tistlia consotensis]